jgi:alpha-1,6-mannosyltransferase
MAIKTLHLTNAWSETSGGVATFYRELLKAANRHRRQIRLVVPAANDSVEPAGEFGRIYHVAAPKARLNPAYRILYPNQYVFSGSKIQEILKLEQPDLVEINDKYTLNYLGPILRLGLARSLGFRPVVTALSCERMDRNVETYLCGGRVGQAFCGLYMRWVYFPFFDHHIGVSQFVAEELHQAAGGHIVPRGVWVLPMGADLRCFSPLRRSPQARRELLERAGGREDSKLLLYAGRLAPEKNLSLLVDTLRELGGDATDFRLVIAGDGISRSWLADEAERRVPGRVSFLGHIADREKLAGIYANCDFFLHPNAREPFGLSLLEAMASGLVVVAPNSGGLTEFATHDNARLAIPSAHDFCAAIREVSGDRALRSRLSNNARATAELYGWDSMTDRYLELYQRLHRIGQGEEALAQAGASFLSTPPGTVRKWVASASAAAASHLFSCVCATAGFRKHIQRSWDAVNSFRGEISR